MIALYIKSFHGTNVTGKDKILSDSFRIKIPVLANQTNKKAPGSLGYGFYTFTDGLLDARRLAYEFSRKFNNDSVVVIKVASSIEETNLLDLNDDDSKNDYRAFYNQTVRAAKNICKNKNLRINNRKQHVFDGVVLELYVKYLETKKNIVVKGIIHDTVTAIGEDGLSDIENSREFCIRSIDIIQKLKEEV